MIILDLETDNLLPKLTKIHCAVCYDTNLNEIVAVFGPEDYPYPNKEIDANVMASIEHLPGWLDRYAPELSCHNGIGFDLKVLKKLYNYEYKGEYRDTLLMSRVLWPDIEPAKYYNDKGKVAAMKGPHSVASWAIRFGMWKPEHEDWSTFSPEMLHRCQEDVKIQAKLYEHIQNYIDEMQAKDQRINFNKIFKVEHKVWEIIEKQCDNGWKFNLDQAFKYVDQLTVKLNSLTEEILKNLPLRIIKNENVTKAFTAAGEPTSIAKKWINQPSGISGELLGDFCKVEFQEINLNSPTQIKDYLLDSGWKAWEYNYKKDKYNKPVRDKYNKPILTSPKLPKLESEEWDYIEKTVNNSAIKLIAQRNKVKHRLGNIEGWTEVCTANEHRVHTEVNSCSTNTARMSHKVIVNIPKVSEKKFFGKEMRGLFTASPGKIMVGCDAKALEARIGAHYIYAVDKEAALKWVSGEIHDENAAGWSCTRDDAKTGLYLLIFGGGAPKLALSLGRPVSDAKELYDAFWKVNPALKEVKEKAELSYKDKGYLLALDSRPLSIRYKHAIISSLFQSGGAIAMKRALYILDSRIDPLWQNAYLGNFHDEFQNECLPEYAELLGKTMQQSIVDAGVLLKLNVPLDGEYKIGCDWSQTH